MRLRRGWRRAAPVTARDRLATIKKWLAVGLVAAVRAGGYSLSSNRVDSTGECGGIGWIIDPAGEVLAIAWRPSLSRPGRST